MKGRTLGGVVAAVTTVLVGLLIGLNFIGAENKVERRIDRLYSLADPRFQHELGVLLGPPFTGGNQVQALANGDEIFPPMLEAIRTAEKTITFETYIYWSGHVGQQFAEALSERARHGVKVHVLLDWLGSMKMERDLMERMTEAGVQIRRFHSPHWTHLARFNNRTHRKLLIIDGRIGFTGGVGIAPQWEGHAQNEAHWRDTHFQVKGPVVAQMQAVFMDNWIKVSGEVLHGPGYFPTLAPVGESLAQVFSSSPSGGSENMQLMYLLSITSASSTIDLSAAYFVPDHLTVEALLSAMKRGVRLRIIVPGKHIDSDTVRSASRARWGPLLAAGALIAEYAPTMYHCKVMIVDGTLVSVGSTNFDNRSFSLNDEATLNVIDPAFARQQTALFEADLRSARPVSHAQWLARPWLEKASENLASLIGSQL
ncbi:phospholipase D-like domain-containing protein [Aquabacterium sp.]|uniref:phospholipase D-like domain-containing protein n=1 Tax=Aquabacterium sp. TaxID=1872578 RepID=UPI003D6D714F